MTDLDNSKIKVVGLGRDESTTKMVIDNLEVMGVESVWLCVDSEDFDHANRLEVHLECITLVIVGCVLIWNE